MLFEIESRKSMSEIDAALRDAAARHKFGVLSVIDLKSKMNEKGVEFNRDCAVYEVCNPQQAKRALDANEAVSAALPCRISVVGEVGKYKMFTVLPTAIMQGFGTAELSGVASDVEKEIVAMMQESA